MDTTAITTVTNHTLRELVRAHGVPTTTTGRRALTRHARNTAMRTRTVATRG